MSEDGNVEAMVSKRLAVDKARMHALTANMINTDGKQVGIATSVEDGQRKNQLKNQMSRKAGIGAA